jgi:glycosyltransferase involved in cell wall biosynthesis
LLEAMAAGCVVLALDSEPVREILADEQNGLIVPAEDLDAQVRLTREVLEDPGRFRPLGEAAAELIREKYDREVVLPMLAERFQELVYHQSHR